MPPRCVLERFKASSNTTSTIAIGRLRSPISTPTERVFNNTENGSKPSSPTGARKESTGSGLTKSPSTAEELLLTPGLNLRTLYLSLISKCQSRRTPFRQWLTREWSWSSLDSELTLKRPSLSSSSRWRDSWKSTFGPKTRALMPLRTTDLQRF